MIEAPKYLQQLSKGSVVSISYWFRRWIKCPWEAIVHHSPRDPLALPAEPSPWAQTCPLLPFTLCAFVHLGSPVMGGGGGGSLISCWNPAHPARLPLVLWSHFLNSQGKLLLQLFFRNSFPLFKHLHLYFGVNFHRLLLELSPCQARYLVYFIRFPHWPARRLPDTFVLTHGICVLWNLCKVPGLKWANTACRALKEVCNRYLEDNCLLSTWFSAKIFKKGS